MSATLIEKMARAACESSMAELDGIRCRWDECDCDKKYIVAQVRAALSAALDAGWQLVPKEPTAEMITAPPDGDVACPICARGLWRAMLEKAPKP
jgi:hypothetical protein